MNNTYCDFVANRTEPDVHRIYHDRQYGFPINDDNELFGRLILEINQAGLSWQIILNKQDNFKKAYSNFDLRSVAAYNEVERSRLLADAGIIRNRLKIDAAIFNAGKIIEIQEKHGSFKAWLELNHPLTIEQWLKVFKSQFKFVGGEIVNEFLMSTGFLPGAHSEDCPVYKKVLLLKPQWSQNNKRPA